MLPRYKWAIAAGATLLAAVVAVPVVASAATVPAATTPTATTPAATTPAANPYGDPNLVSMFDGTTLNGWTASSDGGYTVKNGTIHTLGNKRGFLYYNNQVGSFRWIFNVRQTIVDHGPSVLFWGTTSPIRDALSGIQFMPPNSHAWDYRVGHNDDGGALFTVVPHVTLDKLQWNQCEIVANAATGFAHMACCPLPTGATTCKSAETLQFNDKTAGRVGPVAIQVHNAGIQDEYKSLYLESPVKTSPDQFITAAPLPPPGVTYQAETLTRTASDSTKVDTEFGASAGKEVTLSSNATGDYVEFTVPKVTAGKYAVSFVNKNANNRAMVQLSINGTKLGTPFDEYNRNDMFGSLANIGTTTLPAGTTKFRFTVTGKNSASKGTSVSVDSIILRPAS